MYDRKTTLEILEQAKSIDPGFITYESEVHKYVLNAPVDTELVRQAEEKFGFTLPEDYFYFITEVGDGGAGPYYGIFRFSDFLRDKNDPSEKKRYEEHRLGQIKELSKTNYMSAGYLYDDAFKYSLKKECDPRPMRADEVEDFGIDKKFYDAHPERFFVQYELNDNICEDRGFLTIGTAGCAYDNGVIITGEMRGKIFQTGEGALELLADSFDDFYTRWLDELADAEKYRQKIERTKALQRKYCSGNS
jgi:hypothetical protein